jgi:DNA-binding NtrC family response regulator
MPRRVLIVEPDTTILSSLIAAVGPSAEADGCPNFSTARDRLAAATYDRLITNLRLGAHNGLHLVYLIRGSGWGTRSIVYTDRPDLYLAHEVQMAGAFYEPLDRLPHVLHGYVDKNLPAFDRRQALVASRRVSFRGGRRRADAPALISLDTGV